MDNTETTEQIQELVEIIEMIKEKIYTTKNYYYRELYCEELLDVEEKLYDLI